MSEVTTGAVSLSLIGAPLAAGAACLGAAYFAGKYCVKQYEKMLEEIEHAEKRLKWLDKQQLSSPSLMAKEARRLQKLVSDNNVFTRMTAGMSKAQKDIFSGVIATQNSPLKAYVPTLLSQLPETNSSFEQALQQGTKSLALDNFRYVNKILNDAAKATGFDGKVKILKQTDTVLDIVFSDKQSPAKKFTAYCKIDKQLNPSLALDLEGFGCDTHECSVKMNEIIKYLQSHGVPFNFKRMKHNQPSGVLRKLLNSKDSVNKSIEQNDYLAGAGNHYLKQKGLNGK